MPKLERLLDDRWVTFSHPRTYVRETLRDGSERLAIGLSAEDGALFGRLLEVLSPPFLLLYLQLIPRGEAGIGRYQSPELSAEAVQDFLKEFGDYLAGDPWHDLWAYSPGRKATLVWDRHDIIYAYGPLDRFETLLDASAFTKGPPRIPSPHAHQRRASFDSVPGTLLQRFDWRRSDLRPEDAQ